MRHSDGPKHNTLHQTQCSILCWKLAEGKMCPLSPLWRLFRIKRALFGWPLKLTLQRNKNYTISAHGTNMKDDLNWNPEDLFLVGLGSELHPLPQGVSIVFYFQNRANRGLSHTWQKTNSWQMSGQCPNLSTQCCTASFIDLKISAQAQDKHVQLTKVKCFVPDIRILDTLLGLKAKFLPSWCLWSFSQTNQNSKVGGWEMAQQLRALVGFAENLGSNSITLSLPGTRGVHIHTYEVNYKKSRIIE